jgi:hypothetical protein
MLYRGNIMRLCFAFSIVLAACGGGGSGTDAGVPDANLEGFQGPDDYCPGSPHCAQGDDGRLFVGAAGRVFTPEITETYTDLNGDWEWESDEPYDDANGNHKFDGTWMFGGGRAANSVFTDMEARAIVFREGDTTVAIVYVDALGVFGQGGDLQQIEEDDRLDAVDVDFVIAGATHSHDSRDALGLWGATAFDSSYDPAYNATLREAAVGAILDAAGDMHEAHATIVSAMLLNVPGDPSMGTDHWDKDTRDPVIFDPTLTAIRFTRADAPTTTIGTLVNWADHPESGAFGPNKDMLSADWPHWLRVGIENGVPSLPAGGADIPGLGGVTVFAQGALGGQVGSLGQVAVPGPDGTPITDAGHPKDQALGTNVARRVLELFATTGETVTDLPISYRTTLVHGQLENTGLQVAFLIDLLAPHTAVGYDPDGQLGPDNTPWLPVRVSYLQVGPLGFATAPGELHPELWVGGYDCSTWTFGYECFDPTRPNLPNFDEAPQPPYLRDLVLANDGVEYPMLLGLAHDFVGYIVPGYNYVLNPENPYLTEAEGDHYEETYSLGPSVQRQLIDPILELVAFRP